ncbi:hypothetical protein [Tersicoccus sp. Bi-70]|uniref:hypothetical protein n=1 Tax=Tersicoccus sp. Bi-70 TaxID=1897634 RepID=UPI0018E9EAB6|nr:hypothetical protein [Tersicoccus sp. Bi-70]
MPVVEDVAPFRRSAGKVTEEMEVPLVNSLLTDGTAVTALEQQADRLSLLLNSTRQGPETTAG